MKLRYPLYLKILLWFFLNLLLLGAAFYAFFKFQFRLGLDSLLLERAGDRVQAVSELVSYELQRSPRDAWDEVLDRYSRAHNVQFVLFRNTGEQVAGEPINPPREMMNRLREPRRPNVPPAGPPFRPGGPMQQRPPELPGGPSPGEERLPRPELIPPAGPRFLLRTSHPTRYWIGLRLPPPERERPNPGPVTLVAVSDSLFGGGLFPDMRPWIALGAGAMVFSVLFWLPLVRGITRSVSRMTRATEEIAAGRFDARVDAERRDELGRLGQAINRMAARLAGFVTGQKRFLGDIAHELCSPIARAQMALGILEQRVDEKQKACVDDVREEVQHMSGLVNELLSFSKASLEPAGIRLQPVAIRPLVENVLRREANAEAKIEVQVEDGLRAQADPDLLQRSLSNLVRNAIRYAGQAGPIHIHAGRKDGRVIITVADRGCGVPEESLAKIFDPFYRPEAARDRETGGAGLGLSIVKTCVESCGGSVAARNRSAGGFEVELRLSTAE